VLILFQSSVIEQKREEIDVNQIQERDRLSRRNANGESGSPRNIQAVISSKELLVTFMTSMQEAAAVSVTARLSRLHSPGSKM